MCIPASHFWYHTLSDNLQTCHVRASVCMSQPNIRSVVLNCNVQDNLGNRQKVSELTQEEVQHKGHCYRNAS